MFICFCVYWHRIDHSLIPFEWFAFQLNNYKNMKLFKTVLTTAVILLVGICTQVNAQSATVQAEGEVLAPLSVTGTNLSFGTEILPGLELSVARTEAGAAQFDITGADSKEITVDFTLPTELTGAGDAIPITFGSDDAGYATTDDQAGAAAHDPSGTLTTTLDATAGTLFVWLGGTISPAETQAAGSYSADITVDTAYTGI